MSRKSTTKAGGAKADTTTTEVATEAVAAAAATMGEVSEGDRVTEVNPDPLGAAGEARPEEVRPEDAPPVFDAPPDPPPPVDPPPSETPPPEDIPTPLAESPAPEVLEAAGAASGADVELEVVTGPAAETAPAAPVSDETFFRCNGCGKPGPAADTEAESLEKALASGWYMSEHKPPLPYCCGSPPGEVGEFPFDRRRRPPAEPAAT